MRRVSYRVVVMGLLAIYLTTFVLVHLRLLARGDGSTRAVVSVGGIQGEVPDFVYSDPCADGVLHPDGLACCAAGCGEFCGSVHCHRGKGGKDKCCASTFSLSCDDHPPPCLLGEHYQYASLSPLPHPRTDPTQPTHSTHTCHKTPFTHHCVMERVAWVRPDTIEAYNNALSNTQPLEIPTHLSPRYNKPKVMERKAFLPTTNSSWVGGEYNEAKCSDIFDVPVYVFELYFTTNFFHIINDNLLPLIATIESIEGRGAAERTDQRQLIFHDSAGRNKENTGLHGHLKKWHPFLRTLSDRPPLFWGAMEGEQFGWKLFGSIRPVCFRKLSFNLVDHAHLLFPIEHLTPEELDFRKHVLRVFRRTTAKTFGVQTTRVAACDFQAPTPAAAGNSGDRPRLVIVSRRPNSARHIVNEKELVAAAEEMGYSATALELDGLSFKEQLEHWATTCVFVAAHGAGIMNALFLPENARIIQVFSFGLRADYAKSSVDCGVLCYRGQYVLDMARMLYGENVYGEIDIPLGDSELHGLKESDRHRLDDIWEVWANLPRIGVNVLIKGKSDFSVNVDAFRQAVQDVGARTAQPLVLDLPDKLDSQVVRRQALNQRQLGLPSMPGLAAQTKSAKTLAMQGLKNSAGEAGGKAARRAWKAKPSPSSAPTNTKRAAPPSGDMFARGKRPGKL